MDAADFAYDHPVGAIYGCFSQIGLRSLVLSGPGDAARPAVSRTVADDPRVSSLLAALDRYFAGEPERFDDVPLDFAGATPFRQAVWEGARQIEWGRTVSYGDLAHLIGKPKAARAVGQALGANPVPLVVPCHRFIGADGSLVGFGAGLNWKRVLLRLEGATLID
ncbi:MAG: methylated-DNA--[protein]-cysteine S-methyltransferase [bacterium]|nr:methylated-DNA--[protein]-cysteine S-methyltransferase [bacterium]